MTANDLLYGLIRDLTDVLYEEHGTGAQYRTTLVGVDYFERKYGDTLVRGTVRETLDAVMDALKAEGIVASAEYSGDRAADFILHLTFKSCILQGLDKELLPLHGKIINCPCANVVMHYVDRVLGKYSEFAEMEIVGDGCKAVMCVMGKALD
jgi:hypothetical protein